MRQTLANVKRLARSAVVLRLGAGARVLTQVSRWPAEQTPATPVTGTPRRSPSNGAGRVGDGDMLRYLAQRPVVQENSGDDVNERGLALAEAYFAEASERLALRIVEQLRVRYVVVRGAGSGHAQG